MSRSISIAVLAAVVATMMIPFAAAAGEVSVDQRYYLRRDDCANLNQDHMYLATRPGSDSEGCTLTFGWAAEVLNAAGIPLTYTYPQEDGLTYVLDTSGELTGRIAIDGAYFAPAAGLYTVDVVLTATYDEFLTATLYEDTVELVPNTGANYVLEFAADIDDSLAGVELSAINLDVTPRGVNGGGPVMQSGESWIRFPHIVD